MTYNIFVKNEKEFIKLLNSANYYDYFEAEILNEKITFYKNSEEDFYRVTFFDGHGYRVHVEAPLGLENFDMEKFFQIVKERKKIKINNTEILLSYYNSMF